jgi:hypothetical protein
MKSTVNVVIITHCRVARFVYASTLIFKTIRTGFPNATIHVVDNSSIPGIRRVIRQEANRTGSAFEQIDTDPVEHGVLIEQLVRTYASGREDKPLVILDSDLVFWDNCEAESFTALIVGKPVPKYKDVLGVTSAERLHSSFLWIPSPRKLINAIDQERVIAVHFRPFAAVAVYVRNR